MNHVIIDALKIAEARKAEEVVADLLFVPTISKFDNVSHIVNIARAYANSIQAKLQEIQEIQEELKRQSIVPKAIEEKERIPYGGPRADEF